MFTTANHAKADQAYSKAEARARNLGTDVGTDLAERYQAGLIDEGTVEELLARTAAESGVLLPGFVLKTILRTLSDATYQRLRAAGVAINYEDSQPS